MVLDPCAPEPDGAIVVSKVPSSPKRGLLYEDIDQKQSAFGDFQTAITLDPALQQAYRNRAKWWIANGQVDKAIQD